MQLERNESMKEPLSVILMGVLAALSTCFPPKLIVAEGVLVPLGCHSCFVLQD